MGGWETVRGAALAYIYLWVSLTSAPAEKLPWPFANISVVTAKGLFFENAKHIYPRTDLSPSKWVHMRAVKRWFQSGRGRCTAGTGPGWDTTAAFKHSLGLEQKLLLSATPILFLCFLFKGDSGCRGCELSPPVEWPRRMSRSNQRS